jgi:hypothetical protein
MPVVSFRPVEGIGLDVIQARQRKTRIMRHELTDFLTGCRQAFPPNKPRGIPCVDERRVLNGIFFIRMIAFDKARAVGPARSWSRHKARRSGGNGSRQSLRLFVEGFADVAHADETPILVFCIPDFFEQKKARRMRFFHRNGRRQMTLTSRARASTAASLPRIKARRIGLITSSAISAAVALSATAMMNTACQP